MPKRLKWKALAQKVLVVASYDENIGDWTAYIDAVEGENHDREYKEVWKWGTKLNYKLAKILFPDIDRDHRWRD